MSYYDPYSEMMDLMQEGQSELQNLSELLNQKKEQLD